MLSEQDKQTAVEIGIPCPNCPNQGWYARQVDEYGNAEQVQCQFCYCEPGSVFRIASALSAARAETWKAAIATVRHVGSTIASGEDHNEFHGLIAATIEALEAASKTDSREGK